MPEINDSLLLAKYLQKYISNNCTEKERVVVEQWLKKSDNERFFKELINKKASSIITSERIDKSLARKALNDSIKPSNRFLFFIKYVAAVAVILVSLSYLFYIDFSFKRKDISKVETIGRIKKLNVPVLYTSTGEKIKLNMKTDILEEKDGVVLDIKENSLHYNSKVTDYKDVVYNTIEVPRNCEYFIKMFDGTEVWLNSDTKFKYPVNSNGGKRNVYLSGEAYFKVAKDKKHPFVVSTNDFNVEVLGTEFNVKAYVGQTEEATLVEGSIKVNDGIILKANEQAIIKDGKVKVVAVDPFMFTCWKEGVFVYHKVSLNEILKQLSRWYDFEYFYQNKDLEERLFTAKIKKYDSIERILEILEKTRKVKFKVRGKTIIVMK